MWTNVVARVASRQEEEFIFEVAGTFQLHSTLCTKCEDFTNRCGKVTQKNIIENWIKRGFHPSLTHDYSFNELRTWPE